MNVLLEDDFEANVEAQMRKDAAVERDIREDAYLVRLRDDFAGRALQCLLDGVASGVITRNDDGPLTLSDCAASAYEIADAMLAERSK